MAMQCQMFSLQLQNLQKDEIIFLPSIDIGLRRSQDEEWYSDILSSIFLIMKTNYTAIKIPFK